MAILEEFSENFELLLYLSYKKHQEYPLVVAGRRKRSGGGICCRNGDALKQLRYTERQLRVLNNDILRFFGVDKYCLPMVVIPKKKRGRPRKNR